MTLRRKTTDWTYAAFEPIMPDLSKIQPKKDPVYQRWTLREKDFPNDKPVSVWAHHDKLGWHGWPMRGERVDKSGPFTTWPELCWVAL